MKKRYSCLLMAILLIALSFAGELDFEQSTKLMGGQNVITNSIGMKLVWILPGEFDMGDSDERPVHRVKISKGFWMGQTEVTQAQYKAVMDTAPWSGKSLVQQSESNPAVYVSWNDAVEFCKKLSQQEGRTYRLPTEAEWEYACRAGTKTRFSFGEDSSRFGEYGWYRENTQDVGKASARDVAQKKPNPFSLYDMHGNVWELCSDWYSTTYYSRSPSIDPQGPPSGDRYVVRGGSWHTPWPCQSVLCSSRAPDSPSFSIGFRTVLEQKKNLDRPDGLDDIMICEQILSIAGSWGQDSSYKYDVTSIDRIYESLETKPSRAFYAYQVFQKTHKRTGKITEEFQARVFWLDPGYDALKPSITIAAGNTREEYEKRLHFIDNTTNRWRILYPKHLQEIASSSEKESVEKENVRRLACPSLEEGHRKYVAYVYAPASSSLGNYEPGEVFWTNEQGLRQLGVSRFEVLDDTRRIIRDESLARRLFRAAAVRYSVWMFSANELSMNSADVEYIRSMTANPAFAATFVAQGAKSFLTSPRERYKAIFLDVMLADTDEVYLTQAERKMIAGGLESAKRLDDVLSTYVKIARKLPSGYVKKLDDNWMMIRRGQQWQFVRRKEMPNIGLAIEAAQILVELTHNQVVLKGRANKLKLIRDQIIRQAPADKRKAMSQGLNDALVWSEKVYKDGLSNAMDKTWEVARKEGIDFALNLLSKMSTKANHVLLAFEIPEVIFNMDGMYDSNAKAQCAIDVSSAINTELVRAIEQAKNSERIDDWQRVDALYLLAYLTKGQFHHHAANMLESSEIGRNAGDFLTQGKTTQWIESQKNMCKNIGSMIEYWEKEDSINECIELVASDSNLEKKSQ